MEKASIRAYVSMADFEKKSPHYGARRFVYDAEQDLYRCPKGEPLRLYTHSYTERLSRYRADPETCNACPLKPECTPGDSGRVLMRSFDEEILERVRAYRDTGPYEKALRKRKVWVEPMFGEAKEWHGMSRFRLRRLWRVNVEALLIAAGQNIKRLLAFSGRGPSNLAQAAALRPRHRPLRRTAGFSREAIVGDPHRPSRVFQQAGVFSEVQMQDPAQSPSRATRMASGGCHAACAESTVVVLHEDAGRQIGPYRIAAGPGFLRRQAAPPRCVLHKTPRETGAAAPPKVPRPSAKVFSLTPITLYVFALRDARVAEGQVVPEQEVFWCPIAC